MTKYHPNESSFSEDSAVPSYPDTVANVITAITPNQVYGLCLGVSAYKDKAFFGNLHQIGTAAPNAKAMNEVLKNHAGDSRLLHNHAGSGEFHGEIQEVMAKAKSGDLVVVYFSGHGCTIQETTHAEQMLLFGEVIGKNLTRSETKAMPGALTIPMLKKWVEEDSEATWWFIFDTGADPFLNLALASGLRKIGGLGLGRKRKNNVMISYACVPTAKNTQPNAEGRGLFVEAFLTTLKFTQQESTRWKINKQFVATIQALMHSKMGDTAPPMGQIFEHDWGGGAEEIELNTKKPWRDFFAPKPKAPEEVPYQHTACDSQRAKLQKKVLWRNWAIGILILLLLWKWWQRSAACPAYPDCPDCPACPVDNKPRPPDSGPVGSMEVGPVTPSAAAVISPATLPNCDTGQVTVFFPSTNGHVCQAKVLPGSKSLVEDGGVAEIADEDGRKGAAQLVQMVAEGGDYYWKKDFSDVVGLFAPTTAVAGRPTNATNQLRQQWANPDIRNLWNESKAIIVLGLASEEVTQDEGEAGETKRANARANNLGNWLHDAGIHCGLVQKFVLGRYNYQGSQRVPSDAQRPVLLVRVLDYEKDMNLAQALRRFLSNQHSGWQLLPGNFTNGTTATLEQVRWNQPCPTNWASGG